MDSDNCVAHHGRLLRIPPQRHRIHDADGRLEEASDPAREAA